MSHCFLPKLREYLCFDEPTAEKKAVSTLHLFVRMAFRRQKNGIIISSIEKNMWKNNGYSSKQEYRREWKLSHSETQTKNQQTINFSYACFSMHFFFRSWTLLFYLNKCTFIKCYERSVFECKTKKKQPYTNLRSAEWTEGPYKPQNKKECTNQVIEPVKESQLRAKIIINTLMLCRTHCAE